MIRILFLCIVVFHSPVTWANSCLAGYTDTVPEYRYRPPSVDGTGKYYMGREIAPVMGPGGISWLDRSSRPNEEQSQKTIELLHVQPSDVIADIGAGSGYYAFQLARLVPDGKVYAVDIQPEMIAELNRRKVAQQAANVIVVQSDSADLHLPSASVDIAILVDVYHELSWPREILSSIYRSLKGGGRLVLVEYRAEDPAVPIKPLHKTSVKQVVKELSASGFMLKSRNESLPLQHFLVFGKNRKYITND